MICPYCNNEAEWAENKAIYGRNFGNSYMCYYCKPCDAYVGCHNNSRKPLGTMANAETRNWRKLAHAEFDPLWKTKKKFDHYDIGVRRNKAYGLLKKIFGFDVHIGEADIELCKKIIQEVSSLTTPR